MAEIFPIWRKALSNPQNDMFSNLEKTLEPVVRDLYNTPSLDWHDKVGGC